MKNIIRGCVAIFTVLIQTLSTLGATFTSDTTITFTNLDYDGADIVVTNCTLTIEGSHTFASLHLENGAKLTQTQTDNGLRFAPITISNEPHVLTGTNLVTLNNSNVLTASPIMVTDPSGTVTYANGPDYVLITNLDTSISMGRVPSSSIPDGGTVLVSYSVLSLLGATGVNLVITGDLLVNSNSTIDVNGLGYGTGFGPGPGGTLGGTGSGGGHGGYGGPSATNAPGGVAFDSISQPADKGCAGGNGLIEPGGAGGGAIKLVVGGLLRVDGLITANGANGTNNHSGGGAGGSIWLSAELITGSGSIRANGGDGEPSLGGGGGGGCIALYFSGDTFSGTLEAHGGQGPVYGGAGTIYSKAAAQSVGNFLADNGGHRGTNTLLSTSEAFNATVKSGAVLSLLSTQTVGSLVLSSNGWVSCVNQWLNILTDATIQAGAGIIADGTGYSNEVHGGVSGNYYGYYTSGGGGYGGVGAPSKEGPPGGVSYGSILQPIDLGSGGGNVFNPAFPSGRGGGAVFLTVGGTLSVDGRISSEGVRGRGQGGGGGSGGSVWITTSNLIGSGTISANGAGTDGLGGGGGGGRIAIYFQSNNFNGAMTAFGGVGGNVGGAGTIYTRDLHQSVGKVLVDNGGPSGTNTVISSQEAFDLIAQRGAVVTPIGVWSLKSLTLSSNANVVISTSQVTISGDVSISSDSGVIADGTGYGPAAGPGFGHTILAGGGSGGGSTQAGTGASHGGFGGQTPPGNSYDSVSTPAQMGSGGGNGSGNLGGSGGGAISFLVGGNLMVNGRISANGMTPTNQNCGGGSGGTINLNVGTLSGSGLISANGGAAGGYAGGGGGGRISISYSTIGWVGNLRAFGGLNSPFSGGAGTIYLKDKAQSIAQILIDNGGTIGSGTDVGSGGSAINLTLTGGGAVWGSMLGVPLFQSLTIESNSFYYLSNSSTITVLGSATVGGGIVADGAGSPANSGTGAGRYSLAGTGGGYGGFGASGSNFTVFGGTAYGIAAQPSSFGSGGGGFSPNAGGSGGGAVRINVTGTLALDGKISADGRPGTGLGGGGSGGSVWLTAGNFTGSGFVSANGGSGSANGGGGGGGGRIAITTSPGTNSFSGIISAYGGNGYNRGGAGTIYTRFGFQNVGQVLVDNGGVTGTNTTFTDSALDLIIRNGGNMAVTGISFNVHDLLINSNAWLTVASASITVSANAIIQSGGGIVADGTSLTGGQGGGRGAASGLRGGGGYGGWGAANPTPFGISYGSLQTPTDMGSVGGSGSGTLPSLGGVGGGAIHLTVFQNLTLDGRISANGNPGGLNSGGGSGGSVWLQVSGGFSGAGLISANGGSGDPNFGGGGGGGRISLSYGNNLFTGTVTAFGGGGAAKGGAGTIYFKANSQNRDLIMVDNGGGLGTNTGIGAINSVDFDLSINGGAWLLATPTFPQTHNITIASNAALAFASFSSPLTVSGDLTVQQGGAITADGKGFPGGFGPGIGGSFNQSGFGTTGGGGGHGGLGASSFTGASGGISYGLISSPVSSGSGGGNGSTIPAAGGSGGGIIPLNVLGTIVINGSVTANGVRSPSTGGGGGAGGSIFLTVGALAGSGIVSANGGPGNGFGGGGGGGRIAIRYHTNTFNGLLSACGGISAPAGGAGTICVQSINNTVPNVVVDNGGYAGTNTPLDFTQQVMLTVQNGAVAHSATGSLLLSNLVIGAGGKFTSFAGQTNSDVVVLGNATIQAGGTFSLDGLGYGPTNGPGAGTNLNGVGSGAGYGGTGGASSQSAGGGTYGSASQPIDLGSGGGAPVGFSGSEGGGALRLMVSGTLAIDGQITADGHSGVGDDAGGGAGGSLWLAAGSVSGSGLISADGGNGELFDGGGGGGGRIAVYSTNNNFAGTYSILGGEGFSNGQSGSLFTSSNYPTPIVLSQTPAGTVTDAVGSVTLLFNTPVNSGAVSQANFQLMTPDGVLPQSNVVVSPIGSSGLRFSFPLKTLVGNYTFTFGPQIGDVFGQPMSQVYTGAFSVLLPVVEGLVTDTNGQPVTGVVLQANGGFSATTGTNGEYALGVIPPGAIITPIKSGYMFVPGYRSYNQVSTSISNENYLAVTTIAPNVAAELRGTNFVMQWAGISGVTYQFFFSTNLIDWESTLPLIPGANGPMQLSIPIFSDNPVYYPIGFYRLNAKNY